MVSVTVVRGSTKASTPVRVAWNSSRCLVSYFWAPRSKVARFFRRNQDNGGPLSPGSDPASLRRQQYTSMCPAAQGRERAR